MAFVVSFFLFCTTYSANSSFSPPRACAGPAELTRISFCFLRSNGTLPSSIVESLNCFLYICVKYWNKPTRGLCRHNRWLTHSWRRLCIAVWLYWFKKLWKSISNFGVYRAYTIALLQMNFFIGRLCSSSFNWMRLLNTYIWIPINIHLDDIYKIKSCRYFYTNYFLQILREEKLKITRVSFISSETYFIILMTVDKNAISSSRISLKLIKIQLIF